MAYEHPLDRLGRRLRPVIFSLIVLAAPVSLIGFGVMVWDFIAAYPWWAEWTVIPSIIVVFLGISAQIDTLKERQS